MDFNTQRKAVAAVMDFGRKTKVFYPFCVIAKYIIILFCAAVRAVDMAFSDDNGRFLGMEHSRSRKNARSRTVRSVPERKTYVKRVPRAAKRGFFSRLLGGVLAAGFTFSVLPSGLTLVSFAASSSSPSNVLNENVAKNPGCTNDLVFTWDGVTGVSNYFLYIDDKVVASTDGGDADNNAVAGINKPAGGAGKYSYTYSVPNGTDNVKYRIVPFGYNTPGKNEVVQGSNGDKIIVIAKLDIETDTTTPGQITVTWKNPDKTPAGYNVKASDNNYTLTISDGTNTASEPVSGTTKTLAVGNTFGGITIATNTTYTFTVKQNCADTSHDHYFESKPVTAVAQVAPTGKPVVKTTPGNRQFTVHVDPDPTVNEVISGYKIVVKNNSTGETLHDENCPVTNGNSLDKLIQIFNKPSLSGTISPQNAVEYTVTATPYTESKDMPDYKYEEHSNIIPGAQTSDVASVTPSNVANPRGLVWALAAEPENRGVIVTWDYTFPLNPDVANIPVDFNICRRPKVSTGDYEILGSLTQQTGSPGETKVFSFVDKKYSFAYYTPIDSKDSGYPGHSFNYIDYKYEYQVQAFIKGESDPVPITFSEPFVFDPKSLGINFGMPSPVKSLGSDGKITLNWPAVDGADAYLIYRDPEGDGTFEAPIFVDAKEHTGNGDKGDTVTWLEDGLVNKTTIDYRVSAIYTHLDPKANNSEAGRQFLYETDRAQVKGTSGEILLPPYLEGDTSDGTIVVTWDEVEGADYYMVSYSCNGTNPQTVTIYDKNELTLKNLHNGDVYTFKAKSYKIVNNAPYSSEESNVLKLVVGSPIYPPVVSAVPGNEKVTLTWVPMTKDASGYNIYRYYLDTDTYEILTQSTDTTYVHTGLENGTTYWYAIKAFKDVAGERILSDYSIPVNATPDKRYASDDEVNPNYIASPLDFSVTTSDGTAILSWTDVNGATGYRVYMLDRTGTPVLLGSTSKPGISYPGLKNGEVYTYTVTAYKSFADGSITESNYATPKSITVGTYLSAPIDVTAVAGDRKVTLSWSEVSGANGYVVYAYNAASNSFAAVGVVSKPGFTHENLENGLTYSYMIAAYRTVGLSNQYSQYSLAVSATPYAPAPDNNNNPPADGSSYNINIVGTVPEGISHAELIGAYSDESSFDQNIDIRFSVNTESSKMVYDVLSGYANGLDSFDIYPFDISCYVSGTDTKITPYEGHYVTLTMPIPDSFRKYGEDMQLMHLRISDDQMEIIPLTFGEADGIPLVQFKVSDFSPFAFVHYYSPEEIASRSGAAAGTAAGTFAAAGNIYSFRCTSNGGFRLRKRNKVYKLVKKS